MTFSPRPHFKYAQRHRKNCRCLACRIWRRGNRADKILGKLEKVEKDAGD